MPKLNPRGLDALIRKPPKRHPDGDGLFFKVAGGGKAYWTYRFTLGGKESETSLGPYPEMSLDKARIRHLELRAAVAKKIDPVAERGGKVGGRAATATPSAVPTFGEIADAYLKDHDAGWKNAKHAQQWAMTLTIHAKSLRNIPVDQVDTAAVLDVLEPIWNTTPETASRLRGRIEAVLASAQVDGWIEEGRSNPARWKNWLDHKLVQPKKIGSRGHHAAMPFKEVPSFMARLAGMEGVAALALRLTILTACRTSEVLGATFDEVDFDTATWVIPKERMKMGKPHRVPLSDAALAIIKAQYEIRGRNPHVFAGRPTRPLSNMSMAMLLRRMGADNVTVHGFRSAFRDWATEVEKAEYATAERCLAHTVGSGSALSYDRSDRLDLRRPIMSAWSRYICAANTANVPQRIAEHASA